MKRERILQRLQREKEWDVLIIGGGATGLGAAVDAASRGYKTLLLEAHDFAKATSSRSTKLIHGGLRYLKQGNIHLVTEALKERGLLCKNAPQLIGHLPFLVPNYHWWEGPFYGMGLKVYDMLAGELGIEKSITLSKEETIQRIPTIETDHLRGATIYYDGQFDDSRLAITLARTIDDLEGSAINYVKVVGFIKHGAKIRGVRAVCQETNNEYEIYAKAIINATGIFTDELRKLDDPNAGQIIRPAQGVHLVLDRSFLNSSAALMIPKTEDGRVLFVVPWKNHVLVGTTDTDVPHPELEPKPFEEEVDFLLKHAAKYLTKHPERKDVLSAFAGLRPLVNFEKKESSAKTARDHSIIVSPSHLISICGGKWTTYRKMGEDVIDRAIQIAKLTPKPCMTKNLRLHGYLEGVEEVDSWSVYGSDARSLSELAEKHPDLAKPLHPDLTYLGVEVLWAVRHEMARTVEDVLARRIRALFLNAKASIEVAPNIAKIMAKELSKTDDWVQEQITSFSELAKNYLLS